MAVMITPTQSDINAALRAFLLAILPAGTEVILAYGNRVPEPAAANFVVMIPVIHARLSTNIDIFADTAFTGAIAGAQLTVSALALGAIKLGATLFAEGVPAGITIAAFGTGTGGPGTYTLSQDCGIVASEIMASGEEAILQPTNVTIQCDCHGPASAENAQAISTAFRDNWGFDFFAAINPDIAPLYTDDAKLIPYLNDSQQIENRWTISCSLQANQKLSGLPQQFADELAITTIEVEAAYPAI